MRAAAVPAGEDKGAYEALSEKKKNSVRAQIIKSRMPVKKAETPTAIQDGDASAASIWEKKSTDMRGLKALVDNSTIIPQCIRAYKNNIAGFGIGVRYKEDYKGEENPEMEAEFEQALQIIELLNMDHDTKELFEQAIVNRETYGVAYMEVIRDMSGNTVEVAPIENVPSFEKSRPLEPYVDVKYIHNGTELTRKKRFCKYRQTVGGKTVYFKEIGDPRVMNKTTGEYQEDKETILIPYRANEIIEFKTGGGPYGEVRWIGQVLGIDGSRKAEALNNRYFEEGRHTPMMIMIKNGTLTEDSWTKLQEYMNGIKGAAGQHAFMVLETENGETSTDFDDARPPDIEIKDMAAMLQKDELFQEYLDNSRRRIQSAFQLPDLYVAYTTDFNRATAQTAQEVTEKQVFQPERRSLAWIINNKLLAGYNFKYVEAYFLEPQTTNPDDVSKILNITERAGGLSPNKAKEITYSMLGAEAEPYEGDWGETPLALQKNAAPQTPPPEADALMKSAVGKDEQIYAVLKEMRGLLEEDAS